MGKVVFENKEFYGPKKKPDFVKKEDFDWAVEEASRKKKMDCFKAEFYTVEEGLIYLMQGERRQKN